MRLRIQNYKSLIGIVVRGKWNLTSIDELDSSYMFWFDDGKEMSNVTLKRDGVKAWDAYFNKNRWTYRIMDGGSVTADWFTPQNAVSIFTSALK